MAEVNVLLTEDQSLTPEDQSFIREVETTYLNLFAGGLLSTELERLVFERWAKEKIPLNIIINAMSNAAEVNRKQQKGMFPRRPSINFTDAFVKRELKQAKNKAVGAAPAAPTPDPGLEERRRLLCERLAEEGRVELDISIREAYRRAYRKLLRLKADHEMADNVRRIDEILCKDVYNFLKSSLREQIDEQVQTALQGMSNAADREALQEFVHATRRRELRQRLQLFKLVL
jgi:hypothetical protein